MGLLSFLFGTFAAMNAMESRVPGHARNIPDEDDEALYDDGCFDDYVGDGLDGTDDYLGDGLDGADDHDDCDDDPE